MLPMRVTSHVLRSTVIVVVLPFLFAMASPAQTHGEILKTSGAGGALEAIRLLGEEFGKLHPDVKIAVLPGLGSTGAIKAVLAGSLDIAVSARPIHPEESRNGAVPARYAATPFVFGTAVRTKPEGFTIEEYVGIFAGTRKAWPDGTPIRLVLRPDLDSHNIALKHMSPAMEPALKQALSRKGMLVATTDIESADMIEKVPGALGTTTLGQILAEKRKIRPLEVNGVAPTIDALKDGSYPYSKTLLLVTRGSAAGNAGRFVEFVRSGEGRRILAKTGHLVPDAEGETRRR
jgi:phosphate transport system substrate-binding protein